MIASSSARLGGARPGNPVPRRRATSYETILFGYAGNMDEYVAFLRTAPCLQVGHLCMGLLIEQHMHASRSYGMFTEVPDHRLGRTATNDTSVICHSSTAGKEATRVTLQFWTPTVSSFENGRDTRGALAEYVAVENLSHAVCGIYLWEWARSFSYELDFYTGKRKWKHTLWLYLICRYTVLGTIVNILVVLNVPASLNCLVWVKFEILLPYAGLLMASSLIIIRVIAIWNRHPIVIALSAAALLAQVALLIYSVTIATDTWQSGSPLAQGCVKVNLVRASLPALATTFAIDASLLLVMLVGLLRRREACRFGLGGFLLKQGLIWLALATTAELPTVIVLSLNVNDALHQLFITPEVIILAIAATNMYRALTDFSFADRMSLPSSQRPIKLSTLARNTSRKWAVNDPASPMQSRPVEIEVSGGA
ncbi:unnamed protein product [Peniophora sp. CBMAI 1063]|nr:unnamed protein product [Peniophora sp. CBMAI 1063]